MTRAHFKKIAKTRLAEAKVLYRKEKYSGAYYLAGYCIECSLKACIAKKVKKSEFPPAPEVVKEIYTHNLTKLIKSAGLGLLLEQELKKDSQFAKYWNIVKDWNEKSRYTVTTEKVAEDLIEAISNSNNGVFKWIKLHW